MDEARAAPPRRLAWWRVAVGAWAVGIWVALTAPSSGGGFDWARHLPAALVPWVDDVAHAGLFFGLAWLAVRATAGRRRGLVAACCLAYGVVTELAQRWVPGRSAELTDLLADALGVALAFVPGYVVARRASRPE